MTGREHDVRRQSVRVALGAAGVVGVTYLMLSVVVLVLLTHNLTQQVDDRLASYLSTQAADLATGSGDGGGGGNGQGGRDRGDRPFGPPTLAWRVASDGAATYVGPSDYATTLPSTAIAISTPQTVTLDGTALRLAGTQVGAVRIVVAQTLGAVSDAQSTLLLAEAVLAPVLLLLVFAGAVLVGRRVASPVEAARKRQLEFTADASHELRTPLSVIEAHTSLGLATERSAEWYRGAFGKIDAEARRMRRLLDDMLWLARFDAARGPGRHEPVDLATIAGATVERFEPVAEARHLTLTSTRAAHATTVIAPAEWLDRLVAVLLDNACKYAPDGGTVDVHVTSERGRAVLGVDDSGPGIPPEQRGRIFDRFHRATEQRSGAGLGLAIADAIVQATGGAWQVGSSPSGGARMSVSWPEAGGPRAHDPSGRDTVAERGSADSWPFETEARS